MITVFKTDQCSELDDILSSIFACIEGTLSKNTASGKLRVTAKDSVTLNFELHHRMNFPRCVAFKVGSSV
jgi:hypothetical protein